jgi:N-acetylneuraminic acid mutarotase
MNVIRYRRLVGCLFVFGLLATPVTALAQGGASWSLAGAMAFERGEVVATAMDGKIYVLTGMSPGNGSNGLGQEYDPATGNWRDLAIMPSVASHAGAASVGGKIYVVGGFTANVHIDPVNRVFEYDPAADSWRAVMPLSAPRGSAGVVALNGKIHAIGGRNVEGKTVATHEIFDPSTGRWTAATPLPIARDHLGIAALDGRVHVFGGRYASTAYSVGRHDVYDPATDSWSLAAPLLTPRSAGVGFALDGRIVYAGGECKDTVARDTYNEAEIYDPQTDSWTALPPMLPAGKHGAAASVVGGQAYVFGGYAGCGGDRPSKDVVTFQMP